MISSGSNGSKKASENEQPKLGSRLKKHERRERTILNPKYRRYWLLRLGLAIKDTFWEYTKKTKVSGMWLLQPQRTHGATRCIWSTVLFCLFLLGVYLSLQLWLKFYSYPILNTISSDLAITDVAFPGVTICSPKVVNMDRVERLIKKLKIPAQYDPKLVAAGFDYINSFTDRTWAPPPNMSWEATDAVLHYNNISIYEAAMLVSAGCPDFVKRCFWGSIEFPCAQHHEYLSFMPTSTYLGPCCSFNYNPKNVTYVPFSSNIFGMDGGLSFIGVEGSDQYLSTGLLVIVHHPVDFATEVAAIVTITANSESFVEIAPTVQSSSTDVLELSERKRDCLISNDLELRNYRQAACILACQTEIIYKKCKCQPYHLPNERKDYKECKLSDTECYMANFDDFIGVKCDECMPNCYDVTYSTLAYKTDLNLHNYSVSMLYKDSNLTKNSYIVRVFLAKQMVPSVKKVTVMSWIGLLSDLGGVFNLCLGLSIISIVEFFYYCTYRLYVNFKIRSVLMRPLKKSEQF